MENTLFKDMEISKEIKKAIADMGFEVATPIQEQAIPCMLEGKDVIGLAQTGTGKTCAFGIPAVEMVDTKSNLVQTIILAPTRELVIQIRPPLSAAPSSLCADSTPTLSSSLRWTSRWN